MQEDLKPLRDVLQSTLSRLDGKNKDSLDEEKESLDETSSSQWCSSPQNCSSDASSTHRSADSTHSSANPYLRRAASGQDYDATEINKAIFPPFALRMNAYEKVVRKFMHVYNCHDIDMVQSFINDFAMPDMQASLCHQRCFAYRNKTTLIDKLNPMGLPNFIKMKSAEDVIAMFDFSFNTTPDSCMVFETVFHKRQASRTLPAGHKVVMGKLQLNATFSKSFPVRKSILKLLEGLNIRCLDDLSADQVLKVKTFLTKLELTREVLSRTQIVCKDMFPTLEVGCSDDDSQLSREGASTSSRKRKKRSSATKEAPLSLVDRIAHQVLPPELEGVLSAAKTVFRSKASTINYSEWMADVFSALAFGDELVPFTMHIPITLHMICSIELNGQDKCCNMQYSYWDTVSH